MQRHLPIRIGTRKSVLALAQAELVRARLHLAFPMLEIELVPIITSGDKNTDKILADIGGKGLFTLELEEQLKDGRIDIAVHSLKDMETFLTPGLMIAATLERADPRDVLVSRSGKKLHELPAGAQIGTSSPRRAAQILIERPDLEIIPFRGNVITRLAKLKDGEAEATLLALAGLARLNKADEATEILDTARFTPASGQGTIAIECAENNEEMLVALAQIDHLPTHTISLAERAVLAGLGGSCRTPIAAYGNIIDDTLYMEAMVARPDGSAHVKASRKGHESDAVRIGGELAQELLSKGGKELLS